MSNIPLIVVDTNILVSGLLSPFGVPGRIVDLILAGQVRVAYNDRILVEYQNVLSRKKFSFPADQVDRVLAVFNFQQKAITVPWPFQPLPDPDDAVFLEVAAATSKVLVSGNIKHFPPKLRGGVIVLTPTEWLTQHFGA